MRITESQLRRLIRETLAEQAEGLDEGFMDKVKGTFGIGAKKKRFDKPGGKMSYYNSPGKQVFDGAVVKGDAKVFEPAKVMGSKCVIDGDAMIYENAVVKNSKVSGPCHIHGNARVQNAVITCDYNGGTRIRGDAKILGGTWHNINIDTGTYYSYEEYLNELGAPERARREREEKERDEYEALKRKSNREEADRRTAEERDDPYGEKRARESWRNFEKAHGMDKSRQKREEEQEREEFRRRKRELEREERDASSSNYERSTGADYDELERKRRNLNDMEVYLRNRGIM